MRDYEPLALDYFAGGVPTGEFFRMTLDDIRKISLSDTSTSRGINRLQELCFIGLISHFEAFCKDHFASLVNIEPTLVDNLKAAGQDVSVDATHIAAYAGQTGHRLGFLLATKYDFGTPKKINALFMAALGITPLSRDEASRFDGLLRDRHLLVHHGGTFTLQYLEQAQDLRQAITNAFYDSRGTSRDEVLEALDFVAAVARKLLRASHAALLKHRADRGSTFDGERLKAVNFLSWWGEGAA